MSATTLCLTLPTDGGASTRSVYKRLLKKMARDGLGMPAELVGEDVVDGPLGVVRQLADEHPRAVFVAIRRPHVHGLLNCMLRSLSDGEIEEGKTLARAFQFQLALELALDGAFEGEVIWSGDCPVPAIFSPHHGVYAPLAAGCGPITLSAGSVRWEVDGVETVVRPGDGSDRFVPIVGQQLLSLEDYNPISDFEAHPDKEGNPLGCGDAEPAQWAASVADALSRIGEHLPALREEMDLLLQHFVPVGTDSERHLSASYRELIGHVYLTLHPHPMTMTEAVIHEYQHNKINMLFHLDGVLENAFSPLYPSPVRPDPRPLHGVLLAAHAFVPVAELYARMMKSRAPEAERPEFRRRFEAILAKNEEAVGVLRENARPTPSGREVLDELFAIHDGHMAQHG